MSNMVPYRRVGLAFQGGGFAAGALGAGVVKGLVEKGAFDKYDITAFSGTSAGALVAAACWCQEVRARITDNRAILDQLPSLLEKQWMHYAFGIVQNTDQAQLIRLADTVLRLSPAYEMWADYFVVPGLQGLMKAWIEEFIEIDDLDSLAKQLEAVAEPMPHLVLGAADVLNGDIKWFTEKDILQERKDQRLELVRASGSLDEVNGFTIIKEGSHKGVYCDGAWGSNPPIEPLIDCRVDEIWIIENFPKVRASMPKTHAEKKDRQDELWQNSLVEKEIQQINFVNDNLAALNNAIGTGWQEALERAAQLQARAKQDRDALRDARGTPQEQQAMETARASQQEARQACAEADRFYRPITIRKLPMLLDLGAGACFVNSPSFIESMIGYGYTEACDFINNVGAEQVTAQQAVARADIARASLPRPAQVNPALIMPEAVVS